MPYLLTPRLTPALSTWRSALLPALLCAGLLSAAGAKADDYQDVQRLIKAGQASQALTKVDQHLRAQPRDPQMRFLKGVIFSDTGRTPEAIDEFTRLTQEYPELPEPYNNLAVIYAAQSQFDKARAALEQAVRANPNYAVAHENLGDIYVRLASQSYTRALQLDSSATSLPPKLALTRQLLAPVAKP